jgi:hypothetical protein
MSHKERTVASAIIRSKSLWLLFVEDAERKVCEQFELFGRTSKKIVGMKYPLFLNSSFDMCV